MMPFCLDFSGGSQAKDNENALLDVDLMFNGGPLGAKMYTKKIIYVLHNFPNVFAQNSML